MKKFCKYWAENIKSAKEGYEWVMWVIEFLIAVGALYLHSIKIEDEALKAMVDKWHLHVVIALLFGLFCVMWLPFSRYNKEAKVAAPYIPVSINTEQAIQAVHAKVRELYNAMHGYCNSIFDHDKKVILVKRDSVENAYSALTLTVEKNPLFIPDETDVELGKFVLYSRRLYRKFWKLERDFQNAADKAAILAGCEGLENELDYKYPELFKALEKHLKTVLGVNRITTPK